MLPVGVGIGAVIGTGLALLLAPQSGADTRQALRSGANRVSRRARFLAQRAASRAEGIANEVNQEASDARDYVSDYAQR
jgi:gas vesicle protein